MHITLKKQISYFRLTSEIFLIYEIYNLRVLLNPFHRNLTSGTNYTVIHAYKYKTKENYLQVFNSKRFFVDISCIGSTSQCTHRSQIPAVASLRLNDKDSSFRPRCGLFYAITYLYKQMQIRKSSNTRNY